MLHQAHENNMILQSMSDWCWGIDEENLKIIWDSAENVKAILYVSQSTLTKGCKCITGCSTRRCTCYKNGNICSAGCECSNCNNTDLHVHVPPYTVGESSLQLGDVALEEEHMDRQSNIAELMDVCSDNKM